MVHISVVICTYNRASTLRNTLACFSKFIVPSKMPWELIVVDNCSNDTTRQVIKDFAQTVPFPVRYLFEGRQGKSWALNAGVLAAKGEIIAFTDDDVTLVTEWLKIISRTFEEFACMGVAGRIVAAWEHPEPDWFEMEEQQAIANFEWGDSFKEIERPPLGGNAAFRKVAFEKYGLFRTDLGPSGEQRGITCEDTEFGLRLIRGGERIIYAPEAVVYHPVDPNRLNKSYFQTWFYNDGRSSVRVNRWPDDAICYFGVPRWMYRDVASNFLKWMTGFDPKRRFHHKLRTYRAIGRIAEARRLVRSEDKVDCNNLLRS